MTSPKSLFCLKAVIRQQLSQQTIGWQTREAGRVEGFEGRHLSQIHTQQQQQEEQQQQQQQQHTTCNSSCRDTSGSIAAAMQWQ